MERRGGVVNLEICSFLLSVVSDDSKDWGVGVVEESHGDYTLVLDSLAPVEVRSRDKKGSRRPEIRYLML